MDSSLITVIALLAGVLIIGIKKLTKLTQEATWQCKECGRVYWINQITQSEANEGVCILCQKR